MHRSSDSGLVYGPYGAVGYVERGGARQSADYFTRFRSFVRRVMSIFL
jgi:hypothetical protein